MLLVRNAARFVCYQLLAVSIVLLAKTESAPLSSSYDASTLNYASDVPAAAGPHIPPPIFQGRFTPLGIDPSMMENGSNFGRMQAHKTQVATNNSLIASVPVWKKHLTIRCRFSHERQ